MLWINRTKQRYYRLTVNRDLFGDLCLVRTWGSLVDDRGGSKTEVLGNERSLASQVNVIKKQRQQREYKLVDERPRGTNVRNYSTSCL